MGNNKESVRVNFNLRANILAQVDQYAESVGLNRTSAISVLLTQALNQQKTMQDMAKLIQMYEKERDTSLPFL